MNDGSAPWIKIITRIFDNPKIIAIGELPEGDGLLLIWFKLLCLAGVQNRSGQIYLTESVSFTPELLAAKWRCKPTLVQLALTVFQRYGMISIDSEGIISILNWCKYQNEAGLAQIRERCLKQIQDRSAETVEQRLARKRERDAARQRRWRQSHKKNGLNGVVTRNAGVTGHTDVTGVTKCVTPTSQQRETVTPQNKIENKIEREKRESPPTVPQGGTKENKEFPLSKAEINDRSKAKAWLNKLFGRSHSMMCIRGRAGWSDRWNGEEDSLLLKVLPISHAHRDLIQWAYSLPRDSEGWSVIDGRRVKKPKQTLLALLREFSTEIDEWRLVRANLNAAFE
jgi:predicted phage replisome organizer